jgi:hypothetical protein
MVPLRMVSTLASQLQPPMYHSRTIHAEVSAEKAGRRAETGQTNPTVDLSRSIV